MAEPVIWQALRRSIVFQAGANWPVGITYMRAQHPLQAL
jgi:hypothetical protein